MSLNGTRGDLGQRLLFPLPVYGLHVTGLELLSLCPLSINTGGGTLKSVKKKKKNKNSKEKEKNMRCSKCNYQRHETINFILES